MRGRWPLPTIQLSYHQKSRPRSRELSLHRFAGSHQRPAQGRRHRRRGPPIPQESNVRRPLGHRIGQRNRADTVLHRWWTGMTLMAIGEIFNFVAYVPLPLDAAQGSRPLSRCCSPGPQLRLHRSAARDATRSALRRRLVRIFPLYAHQFDS